MKVAMKEFNGVDYNTFDINVASSKSSEHRYIHTEILKLIKNNDYSEYSKMSRYIKDLYQFRITSDYKNEEVSFEKCFLKLMHLPYYFHMLELIFQH